MLLGTLVAGLAGAFLHIGIGGTPIMRLFWLAFMASSIHHRREINRKNKAGDEMALDVSGHVDPAAAFLPARRCTNSRSRAWSSAAGWLLSGISTLPGVWLMIAGASLFINNHIIYYNQRQAILDIRDAEIEARNMSKAFAGRPHRKRTGCSSPSPASSYCERMRASRMHSESLPRTGRCSTLPQTARRRPR